MKKSIALTLALLGSTVLPSLAQQGKPDAEGFVRDWLILAPLPLGGSPGSEEIDKPQFNDESLPAAKEGVKQKIGDKELVWKKISAKTFYVDFKELHPEESESVVAWAVAYLVVGEEKPDLTLKMNSNDQGKVFLNGRELVKFTETRTLDKDAENSALGVTLKKGVNVLVLKVINEENNWQGSVRFLDKSGKPLTDIKVETKP